MMGDSPEKTRDSATVDTDTRRAVSAHSAEILSTAAQLYIRTRAQQLLRWATVWPQ